jgi:hypothetical protein
MHYARWYLLLYRHRSQLSPGSWHGCRLKCCSCSAVEEFSIYLPPACCVTYPCNLLICMKTCIVRLRMQLFPHWCVCNCRYSYVAVVLVYIAGVIRRSSAAAVLMYVLQPCCVCTITLSGICVFYWACFAVVFIMFALNARCVPVARLQLRMLLLCQIDSR